MQRLKPGFVLAGRYRLERPIASGGMGQVWRAADGSLGRTVAVKVLRQAEPDHAALERFRAEARFAARLSHPNVVAVYDFGELDVLAYLVMELVDGPTLAALLDSAGTFDPDWVRSVLVQLGEALQAAHARDVIHCDLKPSNVLVAPNGLVKLMDFGIARTTAAGSTSVTGDTLGTAHYLSPEQALGAEVTARGDLYALGVLGHELLTGRKLFDKESPIATALAHVDEPPPPLPQDVPTDLATVITACLAKDPERRPATAAAVAAMPSTPEVRTSASPFAAARRAPLPRRAHVDDQPTSSLQENSGS